MHWADQIAERLEGKSENPVIASGISISGHIHIGHSNDVFIADSVKRALEDRGEDARVIWHADDYDPMRRVPWPLDEEKFQKYLGIPYANIPSPDPEHESFVDFFEEPFLDSLGEFGVHPEIHSSAEVYREGMLVEQIRTALKSSDEIRDILNQYRDEPLPEDWLPYDPICSECGRLATTRAFDWEDDYVYYSCEGARYVDGCGNERKANFVEGEGKLTWRVEWPARWKMYGVDCEPFGKDHAVAGGSYDTGKEIARKIFDYEPPEPVPYEWISLGGEPMSSSRGQVFLLEEWLQIAAPELLRYFIFRSKAMKAKDFDPGFPLVELYKEYRQLEKIYFGEEEISESMREQKERIYELSQVEDVPEKIPQRIPFALATVMIQVARDEEHVINILERKGVLENPEDWEIELAKERLNRAENWIEKYAPEPAKFKVLDQLPEDEKDQLSQKEKECLSKLEDYLSGKDHGPVEIHNKVYDIARDNDLKPVKLFQAIYRVFLGEKSGPRVGNFLIALEDDFVIERLREASQ